MYQSSIQGHSEQSGGYLVKLIPDFFSIQGIFISSVSAGITTVKIDEHTEAELSREWVYSSDGGTPAPPKLSRCNNRSSSLPDPKERMKMEVFYVNWLAHKSTVLKTLQRPKSWGPSKARWQASSRPQAARLQPLLYMMCPDFWPIHAFMHEPTLNWSFYYSNPETISIAAPAPANPLNLESQNGTPISINET